MPSLKHFHESSEQVIQSRAFRRGMAPEFLRERAEMGCGAAYGLKLFHDKANEHELEFFRGGERVLHED